MPRFPTEDDLGKPANMATSSVGIGDTGAQYIARGAKSLAADLGSLGAQFKAERDRDEDALHTQRLVEFDLAQEKKLDDARRNIAPDGTNFTLGYRGSYDADAKTFIETTPKRLRQRAATQIAQIGARQEKRAYDYELATRDKFHEANVSKSLESLINDVTGAPERAADHKVRGEAVIRDSKLSEPTKRKLLSAYRSSLDEYTIRALEQRYAEQPEKLRELIDQVRSAPRLPGGGDAAALTSGQPAKVQDGAGVRGWTSNDATWKTLDQWQKAAAMALMEADGMRPDDARNALGAMINRAAKNGEDLGIHVSRAIYQPTIEPKQQARLAQIIGSDAFKSLVQYAKDRVSGKESDPVNGATHFLAPEKTMLALEAREPGKYRNWGPRGQNWTGFDEKTGEYKDVVMRDGSHAFVAPGGRFSFASKSMVEGSPGADGVETMDSVRAVDDPTMIAFPDLAPARRRALLTQLGNAMRGYAKKTAEGMIERIKLGREVDESEFGRMLSPLTPQQRLEVQQKYHTARTYADTVRGIEDMPDEEISARFQKLADTKGIPDTMLKPHGEAVRMAEKKIADLRKMRNEDPVQPTLRTRTVVEAARIAKEQGAQPLTPQYYEIMIPARVEAQRKAGTPPGREVVILKEEARVLLQLPRGSVTEASEKDWTKALKDASERFKATFGERYYRQAFDQAINMFRQTQTGRGNELAAGISGKLIRGEPVRPQEYERMIMLDRLNAMDQFWRMPDRGTEITLTRPGFPEIPPVPERRPPPPSTTTPSLSLGPDGTVLNEAPAGNQGQQDTGNAARFAQPNISRAAELRARQKQASEAIDAAIREQNASRAAGR